MGKKSLAFLVWFTCAALALAPLWWTTMAVTQANIEIRRLPRCDADPPPEPPIVHEPPGVTLSWNDVVADDALMLQQPDGLFLFDQGSHVDNASLPAIVLGSRRQAWVRSRSELEYVRRVFRGDLPTSKEHVVAPVSGRYVVTVTYFDDAKREVIAQDRERVLGVLEALSPYVTFRFASQTRHFVSAAERHPQYWSSDLLSVGPLERSIHLNGHDPDMLRSLKQRLGFPGSYREDVVVVGDSPQWELDLWVKRWRHRLCESVNATLSALPVGVSVAADAVLSDPRSAFEDAESAFFHPDVLALLYFPDDHKAAVYLPGSRLRPLSKRA